MKFLTFLLALVMVSQNTFAGPSCRVLQERWESRYAKDFNVDWVTDDHKFDCNGNDGYLAEALYDLETIRFIPSSTGTVPEFYNFMKKLVFQTSADPTCEDSYAKTIGGNMLVLCGSFFSESREERVSTLVHESRHMEADDVGHVDCTRGVYKGRKASCDETFMQSKWAGSGYNADIYYLRWLYYGTRKNELKKSMIRSLHNSTLIGRFNQISPKDLKAWRIK